MLDAQSVVQIYSTDADGDLCIGTGYFCNEDLVITARHVVFSGDQISSGLKLVFPETATDGSPNYQYDFNQAIGFTKDDIVFSGNEQLDIAVIRCPITPRAAAKVKFAAATPSADSQWYIRGFPKAGKVTDLQREPLGFAVKLQGIKNPSVYELHTTVNLDASLFTNENGWGGLSGAPVFANNEFIAVVTNKYKTLDSYFYAVSIPHLFKNPQFCTALKQPIDDAIAEQKQALEQEIQLNVKRLLQKNFTEAQLRECLKLAENKKIDDIVDKLNASVLDALSTLSMILENHTPNSAEDMREISGWLLLNSVDATWWFHNQQRMQQVTGTFGLEKPDYIEIIISRSLLRPAQYGFFDGHGKRPKPRHHNGLDVLSPLTFDSSPEAMMDELLTPIYKDLWGELPPKASHSEILDEIIDKASSKCRVLDKMSKGKIIYYLVGQEHLKLLEEQDWFMEKQAQLATCLRFICCSLVAKSTGQNPCTEGQGAVLAQLSELLEKIDKLGK